MSIETDFRARRQDEILRPAGRRPDERHQPRHDRVGGLFALGEEEDIQRSDG